MKKHRNHSHHKAAVSAARTVAAETGLTEANVKAAVSAARTVY